MVKMEVWSNADAQQCCFAMSPQVGALGVISLGNEFPLAQAVFPPLVFITWKHILAEDGHNQL